MNQSAAFNAGHAAGTAMGYVILFGGLLALGIYFGNRLSKKRDDGTFVRWPVGVALAVILLLLAGQCSSASAGQTRDAKDVGIIVNERIGKKASDFPREFPADFIPVFNDGVRDGIVEGLKGRGRTVVASEIVLSTTVVNVGKHKVLKSEAHVPSKLFWYQFLGVSDSKVVDVICSSRTARPFDLEGSECAATVSKVFGR